MKDQFKFIGAISLVAALYLPTSLLAATYPQLIINNWERGALSSISGVHVVGHGTYNVVFNGVDELYERDFSVAASESLNFIFVDGGRFYKSTFTGF